MTVGYVYMVEMAPERYYALMGTAWGVSEAVVFITITIYYWKICKDWHWLLVGATIEQVLTIILITCFLPESPKWLFHQQKWTECYNTFEYMSKINKKKMINNRQLLIKSQEDEGLKTAGAGSNASSLIV